MQLKQIVVSNECGMDEDAIRIDVIKCGLFMPNTFTPNGDGLNDILLPIGFGISENGYTLHIYNRWGEELFFSTDIGNGWNGCHAGSLLPESVYGYDLRDEINGKKEMQRGTITLLK